MFKCKFGNSYQSKLFTDHNIDFPVEDYFRIEENIFCVADGVTRSLIGGEVRPYPQTQEEIQYIADHYPNPSGAYQASVIFVDNFINYIKNYDGNISEEAIFDCTRKANKDVWEINKDRNIDYAGEDLYCSVATGGIITDEYMYCFNIGDCMIKAFDENCNELFSTKDETASTNEYEEDFLKKGMYSFSDPRGQILIRAGLRNNSIVSYNGKKVGFGALTGEETAMNFVKVYKIPLEKIKYICAYSDGCMSFFENAEIAKNTVQNPESIIEGSRERTLVVFEKI